MTENADKPKKMRASRKNKPKKLSESNFVVYLSIASSFTSIIAFIILLIEKTDANFNWSTVFGGFFAAIWCIALVLVYIYFLQALGIFYRKHKDIGVLALCILLVGLGLFILIILGYFVAEMIYVTGYSFIKDVFNN